MTFALGMLAVATMPLGAVPPSAAQEDAEASISVSTAVPGQTITVRASGLFPGWIAWLDLFPDRVRLATADVRADGSFEQDVVIPRDSFDGPKGIAVISKDSHGKYAYLRLYLTVTGAGADVDVSDTTVVAGQTLQVSGTRFRSGSRVYGTLFPERIELFTVTVEDQRFRTEVVLPDTLASGKHGLLIIGQAASGRFASFPILITTSGGVGEMPLVAGSDPFAAIRFPEAEPSTTPTAPRYVREPSEDWSRWAAWITLVVIVTLLAILGVAWLFSPSGRRWRERRRQVHLGRR